MNVAILDSLSANLPKSFAKESFITMAIPMNGRKAAEVSPISGPAARIREEVCLRGRVTREHSIVIQRNSFSCGDVPVISFPGLFSSPVSYPCHGSSSFPSIMPSRFWH